DSKFIYSTLVPVLRRAKERRQIIVVTHNANIAVLSDAEQIVVLKSTSDKATITHRGSIDDVGTRDAACEILQGGSRSISPAGTTLRDDALKRGCWSTPILAPEIGCTNPNRTDNE